VKSWLGALDKLSRSSSFPANRSTRSGTYSRTGSTFESGMNAPHDGSEGVGRDGRILPRQPIGHLIDDRLLARLDHRDRFARVHTEVKLC
jgi:hypothetical protein